MSWSPTGLTPETSFYAAYAIGDSTALMRVDGVAVASIQYDDRSQPEITLTPVEVSLGGCFDFPETASNYRGVYRGDFQLKDLDLPFEPGLNLDLTVAEYAQLLRSEA